jgi:hypothetical protein
VASGPRCHVLVMDNYAAGTARCSAVSAEAAEVAPELDDRPSTTQLVADGLRGGRDASLTDMDARSVDELADGVTTQVAERAPRRVGR